MKTDRGGKKYTLGLTKDPQAKPIDLKEIYERVKKKKLALQNLQKTDEK